MEANGVDVNVLSASTIIMRTADFDAETELDLNRRLNDTIAGWIAGQVVRGGGFGLVGDLLVGIVGAFIAGWLFPRLHISLGAGVVGAIISAAIGAIILLVIVKLIRRA